MLVGYLAVALFCGLVAVVGALPVYTSILFWVGHGLSVTGLRDAVRLRAGSDRKLRNDVEQLFALVLGMAIASYLSVLIIALPAFLALLVPLVMIGIWLIFRMPQIRGLWLVSRAARYAVLLALLLTPFLFLFARVTEFAVFVAEKSSTVIAFGDGLVRLPNPYASDLAFLATVLLLAWSIFERPVIFALAAALILGFLEARFFLRMKSFLRTDAEGGASWAFAGYMGLLVTFVAPTLLLLGLLNVRLWAAILIIPAIASTLPLLSLKRALRKNV